MDMAVSNVMTAQAPAFRLPVIAVRVRVRADLMKSARPVKTTRSDTTATVLREIPTSSNLSAPLAMAPVSTLSGLPARRPVMSATERVKKTMVIVAANQRVTAGSVRVKDRQTVKPVKAKANTPVDHAKAVANTYASTAMKDTLIVTSVMDAVPASPAMVVVEKLTLVVPSTTTSLTLKMMQQASSEHPEVPIHYVIQTMSPM
jgi:hypothetical protein